MRYFFTISIYFFLLSVGLSQVNVQVTRYDGIGNDNFLELTESTLVDILTNNQASVLEYKPGKGPITVESVSDPSLMTGDYRLKLMDDGIDNRWPVSWMLEDANTGEQWWSDETIDSCNTQEITGRGFSLKICQPDEPLKELEVGNGYIGSSITYENSTPAWLTALKDDQLGDFSNFIQTDTLEGDYSLDPLQVYSDVVSGTWYPYGLVSPVSSSSASFITPTRTNPFSTGFGYLEALRSLNNVNVVLTSDKSKWSRCIVVNTFSDYYERDSLPNPDSYPYRLRGDMSVNKNGNPDGSGTTGFSWFPGYAIDVETGQRLNIFFGENTYFNSDTTVVPGNSQDLGLPTTNGKDMIWNPSSDVVTPIDTVAGFSGSLAEIPAGGQHFIFVTNELYDECAELAIQIAGSPFSQIYAYEKIRWTTIPILENGTSLLSIADGLIPNDVTIKLRVNNKRENWVATDLNDGLPMYEFSLDSNTVVSNHLLNIATDDIALYPNPIDLASGTITSLENLQPASKLTVYNALGELVSEWTTSASSKVEKLHPRLLGIQSAGVFFVVISPPNSPRIVKKWRIY